MCWQLEVERILGLDINDAVRHPLYLGSRWPSNIVIDLIVPFILLTAQSMLGQRVLVLSDWLLLVLKKGPGMCLTYFSLR
jgi:hypothetical protein